MKPIYNINKECFALYTNKELTDLDLENIAVNSETTINIKELCSDYLSKYKDSNNCILSIPINVCTTCNNENKCHEKDDDSKKNECLGKYLSYYISTKEHKKFGAEDSLAIFRYCITLTEKYLGFSLDRNGLPIESTNTSNKIFFDDSLRVNSSNLTEFENRLLFDVCTYGHYNFEALANEYYLIHLNELEKCVNNSIISNLHDFSASKAFQNIISEKKEDIEPIIISIEDSFINYYNDPATHYGILFNDDLVERIKQAKKRDLELGTNKNENTFSLARLEYSPVEKHNIKDNRNISRYVGEYEKVHKLLSFSVATSGVFKNSKVYLTNPFIAKFCYDILRQSPIKLQKLVDDQDSGKNFDAIKFLNYLINLYDNCSINYTDTISTNPFDYYIKKEYSLGIYSLTQILDKANKREISLNTFRGLQKIPAVFSRISLIDYLIDNPQQIENYYNYFFTLHKLYLLTIYQLNNKEIIKCLNITKQIITSYTSFTADDNFQNPDCTNIEYEYPYNQYLLLQLQTTIESLFDKKAIENLYKSQNMKTRLSLKKYLLTCLPNCSTDFHKIN